MRNQRRDHSVFEEWLHAEVDGELTAGQQSQLRRHLASCSACSRQRQELDRLRSLLAESRLPPRPGFRSEVMASLPAAGWEAQYPRSWIAAVVVAALLLAGAAGLIATSSAALESGLPLAAAVVAIADMLRSSALAGAGLVGASWKGLGLAFQEVLGGSTLNLIAVCALVLGLDFLLIRYLMRRRRTVSAPAMSGRAAPRQPPARRV